MPASTPHARHDQHDCRETAAQFLRLVVEGRIEEAYQKHVDMTGRHHNPHFPAGFPALKKAMVENHAQFPHKKITVRNVLGDGDLVAVHSHIVPAPGDRGIAAVHLFRFHGGRIVELWDCNQPLPDNSPNRDGAF